MWPAQRKQSRLADTQRREESGKNGDIWQAGANCTEAPADSLTDVFASRRCLCVDTRAMLGWPRTLHQHNATPRPAPHRPAPHHTTPQ